MPSTSGSTPKRWLANSGVHSVPVRKSSTGTSRKNAAVSMASTAMIPAVVPTESTAHRNSVISMRRSARRVRIRWLYFDSRASSCSMVRPTCDPPCSKTEPGVRAL